MPRISRDKQCKDKDTIERQAINELLELFLQITELETSETSGMGWRGYEN